MREGKPSIVIEGSESGRQMSSFMLPPGEDKTIARRLVELLKAHPA